MRYGKVLDINEYDFDTILESMSDLAYRSSGIYGRMNMYQSTLSQIDRYHRNHLLPNHEIPGLTFFTRPKLNLSQTSLRQYSTLSMLDSLDPTSLPFTVRCLLDPIFCRIPKIAAMIRDSAPFVRNDLPFIVPLTNCLTSLSGIPGLNIDTEETEGGLFSENQVIPLGGDLGNKSYDISVTFRDIQGSVVFSIILYWMLWIILVKRDIVRAYPEDIAANRMSFTSSIYRLVLDPSHQHVVKWVQLVGCFPVSLDIGNFFNISEDDPTLFNTNSFSVTFKANHVLWMKPDVLRNFNRVMEIFAGKEYWKNGTYPNVLGHDAASNHLGIPFIDIYSKGGFNQLKFLATDKEINLSREVFVDDALDVLADAIVQAQLSADPTLPTRRPNFVKFATKDHSGH